MISLKLRANLRCDKLGRNNERSQFANYGSTGVAAVGFGSAAAGNPDGSDGVGQIDAGAADVVGWRSAG